MNFYINPIRPNSGAVKLQSLVEFNIPNTVQAQLDLYIKKANKAKIRNQRRANKKNNYTTYPKSACIIETPTLTNDDIKTLNESPTLNFKKLSEIDPQYATNQITHQWNPEILGKTISLARLNTDIKLSHAIPKTANNKIALKFQEAANRKRIVKPNINDRLDQLKEITTNYRNFLMNSINYKMDMYKKTASCKSRVFNSCKSLKYSGLSKTTNSGRNGKWISNFTQYNTNSNLNLVSPKSKLHKFSSKNLKLTGEEQARKNIEDYFMRNPITLKNFYKVQTIDKEIGHLANFLGQNAAHKKISRSAISLFKHRQSEIKQKIDEFNSQIIPNIMYFNNKL